MKNTKYFQYACHALDYLFKKPQCLNQFQKFVFYFIYKNRTSEVTHVTHLLKFFFIQQENGECLKNELQNPKYGSYYLCMLQKKVYLLFIYNQNFKTATYKLLNIVPSFLTFFMISVIFIPKM